jgi:hypothetical protein
MLDAFSLHSNPSARRSRPESRLTRRVHRTGRQTGRRVSAPVGESRMDPFPQKRPGETPRRFPTDFSQVQKTFLVEETHTPSLLSLCATRETYIL